MSSSALLVEKQGAIAILTLNRPDAMNALSKALTTAIGEAFRELQADGTTRVAILTGAGRAFCAGMDLKELSEGPPDQTADSTANDMADAMTAFEGPIIAAVNGHAVTAGFELALACDVILASTRAKFADTHARVGILPGWGLSQRLPRAIGLYRAKELSFTGNTLDANRAYEWGLVNRVVEPEELLPTALRLAEDMISCVPHVLVQYKQLIDEGFSMHLADALPWELARAIESAKAATAAIIAKRREGVFERGRKQSDQEN